MVEGFLLDSMDDDRFRQPRWIPGAPVKSFWSGVKAPRDTTLQVTTLRCERCGFLESYAREPGRS
jgi:hypothetical protein